MSDQCIACMFLIILFVFLIVFFIMSFTTLIRLLLPVITLDSVLSRDRMLLLDEELLLPLPFAKVKIAGPDGSTMMPFANPSASQVPPSCILKLTFVTVVHPIVCDHMVSPLPVPKSRYIPFRNFLRVH